MNLPKSGFLADAKIEDFNFINEKSHVDKIYSFEFFVDFSADLKSPAIQFLKTGFKYPYLLVSKFQNPIFVWKKIIFVGKKGATLQAKWGHFKDIF